MKPQQAATVDSCGRLAGLAPVDAGAAPALKAMGNANERGWFSAELRSVVRRFAARRVSLSDILGATQERGYSFVLILLAVPFTTPVPLPVVSLPFGFVVTLLGLRQLLERGPWLPRRLLACPIPPRVLAAVFRATGKVVDALELVVRPRLGFVTNHAVFSRVSGLMIAVAGVMLMLPLPLPLSNSLPAATVVLLSIGALGRDGWFFFAGCGTFLVSLAFFALVVWGGGEAVEIVRWIFNG